eukprot:Em0005g428a
MAAQLSIRTARTLTNLCYHVEDFGVQTEWHFFATSHGKSAGDGAGGTLKQLASRANLQRLYSNHILTAKQLYDFAVSEVKGMHFGFATQNEHVQEAKLLEDRLKQSRTVPGTQKYSVKNRKGFIGSSNCCSCVNCGQATRLSPKGSLVFDLMLLFSVSFPQLDFKQSALSTVGATEG